MFTTALTALSGAAVGFRAAWRIFLISSISFWICCWPALRLWISCFSAAVSAADWASAGETARRNARARTGVGTLCFMTSSCSKRTGKMPGARGPVEDTGRSSRRETRFGAGTFPFPRFSPGRTRNGAKKGAPEGAPDQSRSKLVLRENDAGRLVVALGLTGRDDRAVGLLRALAGLRVRRSDLLEAGVVAREQVVRQGHRFEVPEHRVVAVVLERNALGKERVALRPVGLGARCVVVRARAGRAETGRIVEDAAVVEAVDLRDAAADRPAGGVVGGVGVAHQVAVVERLVDRDAVAERVAVGYDAVERCGGELAGELPFR